MFRTLLRWFFVLVLVMLVLKHPDTVTNTASAIGHGAAGLADGLGNFLAGVTAGKGK